MKKCTIALLLILMLPAIALAVTEGVIEEAPMIDLSMPAVQAVSYMPDASYYEDYGDYHPEWENAEEYVALPNDGEWFTTGDLMQQPWLTAGEAKRAEKLLAAYEKGEVTGDGASVLNCMENVIVGVYPLNPADYAGETVYLLLPNCCLTDEQLLAIIDAYHQLGLTFDPAAVNYRNCARGGGVECSRFPSRDESERSGNIRRLIKQGLLVPPMELPAEVMPEPQLNVMYYNGLDCFTFRPYRMLTDDDLMAMAIRDGVHDESADMDYAAMEREGRRILTELYHMPYSIPVQNILTTKILVSCYDAEKGREIQYAYIADASDTLTRSVNHVLFATEDGPSYSAWFEQGTNALYGAQWHDFHPAQGSTGPITDSDAVLELAKAYAHDVMGKEGTDWQLDKKEWETELGSARQAMCNSGEYYISILICTDNGQIVSVEMLRNEKELVMESLKDSWRETMGILLYALPADLDYRVLSASGRELIVEVLSDAGYLSGEKVDRILMTQMDDKQRAQLCDEVLVEWLGTEEITARAIAEKIHGPVESWSEEERERYPEIVK